VAFLRSKCSETERQPQFSASAMVGVAGRSWADIHTVMRTHPQRRGHVLSKIVRQLLLTSGGLPQKCFTSGAGRDGTGEVLAKRIAASGYCSRRDAVRLILAQRVEVNGAVVVDCSTRVNVTDSVAVDGDVVEVSFACPPRGRSRECCSLMAFAESAHSSIRLRAHVQAKRETELIMLHKPPKVLTTTHDPGGRKTVFHLLPPHWQQLRCVGRCYCEWPRARCRWLCTHPA
jgi:hypothetical protein